MTPSPRTASPVVTIGWRGVMERFGSRFFFASLILGEKDSSLVGNLRELEWATEALKLNQLKQPILNTPNDLI